MERILLFFFGSNRRRIYDVLSIIFLSYYVEKLSSEKIRFQLKNPDYYVTLQILYIFFVAILSVAIHNLMAKLYDQSLHLSSLTQVDTYSLYCQKLLHKQNRRKFIIYLFLLIIAIPVGFYAIF